MGLSKDYGLLRSVLVNVIPGADMGTIRYRKPLSSKGALSRLIFVEIKKLQPFMITALYLKKFPLQIS